MNSPFKIPSLEQIEEMDRQRLQSIEALEISVNSVKCQICGVAVPIVCKLTKVSNDRICCLEKRIKWIENYIATIDN